MALTNAEKQKRWRDKRNALAKLAMPQTEAEIARLKTEVARLEAEVAHLKAEIARPQATISRLGRALRSVS